MPNLAFGVYRPPQVAIGDELLDAFTGRLVEVSGFRDGWPLYRGTKFSNKPLPVLCGDLAEAVRRESAKTIAYHWRVSGTTVRRWRRALGVGPITEGTSSLRAHLAPIVLASSYARRRERRQRRLRARARRREVRS